VDKNETSECRDLRDVIPALTVCVAPLLADSLGIGFESYAVGTVHGQDGWSSLGAAGMGNAVYDHQIVANGGRLPPHSGPGACACPTP
jgi:hypothetical protein